MAVSGVRTAAAAATWSNRRHPGIETGNAYVNVHTSQLPAGEIRGQLRAVH
ncbi:MAG: CHRD domain-containing protein [Chloroflexi bacterium]|nr:MAG: CHRD domain-containing protein [Chloroflexota bacterium]